MTNNSVKVVLIGDETVTHVKEVLAVCRKWLETDARFAHSNSNCKMLKIHVEQCLVELVEDEKKFLGKKFTVEKPGDNIEMNND